MLSNPKSRSALGVLGTNYAPNPVFLKNKDSNTTLKVTSIFYKPVQWKETRKKQK